MNKYVEFNIALEDIFADEEKFISGQGSEAFSLPQFHHFLLSLQYLYFNNLHIGKFNKLLAGAALSLNSTAKFYIKTLEKIRQKKEVDYIPEDRIEDFIISSAKRRSYLVH